MQGGELVPHPVPGTVDGQQSSQIPAGGFGCMGLDHGSPLRLPGVSCWPPEPRGGESTAYDLVGGQGRTAGSLEGLALSLAL
jgi:hypothetical protein